MASLATDVNVDELRRRARRRLVGAIVLALAAAVIVPMLLESEPRPLGEDVAVRIPPVDNGKFVNRLNDPAAKGGDAAPAGSAPAADAAHAGDAAPAGSAPAAGAAHAGKAAPAAPPARPRYDTQLPAPADAPVASAAGSGATASTANGGSPRPDAAARAPGAAPNTNVRDSRSAESAGSAGPAGSAGAADAARPVAPKVAMAAPATSPAGTPAPAAARDATAAKAPARSGFAVQLAAFSDDKGANALAGRLRRAGFTVYTEPLKTSKGTLWRVRVGPYGSREAAAAARDKLRAEGQNGIVAAAR